jgi:serine/threonine protein kinase
MRSRMRNSTSTPMSDRPSSKGADLLMGSILAGRYKIEARVGSGAMGAVYRAQQEGLGRCVALKIVNRDRHVGGDTVQRFRREAQALSALHHPNTVRVFDFGSTDEGLLYLAMELLEGEPLTDCLVREGALDVEQAISFTQQVLRSIGEAHAQSIVHRDLKPDNIFLARVQGAPAPIIKVLDFGIAKAVEGDRKIDQFETMDGTVFGTPRYMSPEQAAGRTLDPRSDLYAVGILLYELVAGRPPFVDNDAVVVMARHIRETPLPLCKAAGKRPVPASLEAIVHRALGKTPAERFQTAEEFERALQKCLPDVRRLKRLARHGLHGSRLARLWMSPKRASLAAVGVSALVLCVALAWHSLQAEPEHETARNAAADKPAVQQPLAENTKTTALVEMPSSEALAPRSHVVSVRTAPAAAAVLQGGAELGVTPLEVSMSPGSTLTVLIKKKGFAEHTLRLRAEDQTRLVTLRPLDGKSGGSTHQRRERSHKASVSETDTQPPTDAPNNSVSNNAKNGSPYERF